jgi:hypothetical protein
MPAVDYRSISGFRGPVRLPRWLEIVFLCLFAAATGLIVSWVVVVGFDLGSQFRGLAGTTQTIALRTMANTLLALLLLGMMQGVRAELFLGRDLEMLLTAPLTDAAVFREKVKRLAIALLPLCAAFSIPACAFAAGAGAGPAGVAAFSLGVMTIVTTGMVISLFTAFVDLIRRLILAAEASIAITAILAVMMHPVSSIDPIVDKAAAFMLDAGRWLPVSWVSDAIQQNIGPGTVPAPASFAAGIAALLAVAIAVVLLSRRLYTHELLLARRDSSCTLRDDSQAKPQRERDWSELPLARWIGGKLRARTRAILQFVSRSEEPLLVDRELWILLRNFAIALVLARWVIGPFAEAFLTAEAWLFVKAMIFVFGWGAWFLEIESRKFGGVATLRFPAHRIGSSGNRRVVATAVPFDRGDHRSPFIETWPIDIVEFTKLMLCSLLVRGWVGLTVAYPFALLAQFPLVPTTIVYLAGLVLWLWIAAVNATGHGIGYQRHPRRSHFRDLLVAVAWSVGLATPLVLFVVWTVAGNHPKLLFIAGSVVMGLMLLSLVFLAPLMYLRLVYSHRRRWFDAEYGIRSGSWRY